MSDAPALQGGVPQWDFRTERLSALEELVVGKQIPTLNLGTTDPSLLGWHRETTFLDDYPPGPDPVIFVIGAFSGTIAGLLIEKFPNARHYLFEPQNWAAAQCRATFGHLPNVKVCQFGLGDRSGTFLMALYETDACSFVRGSEPLKLGAERYYAARMEEFGGFMEREGIEEVYYASINIEAYEFVLLPYMDDLGWLERCRIVGVSWHIAGGTTWFGDDVPSQQVVQERLAKHHELVLSIDNWQSWVKPEMRAKPAKEALRSSV